MFIDSITASDYDKQHDVHNAPCVLNNSRWKRKIKISPKSILTNVKEEPIKKIIHFFIQKIVLNALASSVSKGNDTI